MGYHLNAKLVSRGKGHSVIAKAAYNARDKIVEQRTGEIKDYSRTKDKTVASYLFIDKDVAPELKERGAFWNALDAHESRKNSQLALNFIVALPHQLTDQQREFIVKDFAREEFLRKGVAAQGDIHRPDKKGDQRNHHAHILVSLSAIGPEGFGERVFKWEDKEENLDRWREKWAERTSRELEKHGFIEEAAQWRVGHLDLNEQRRDAAMRGDNEQTEALDRDPTKHRGPAADGMERRGEETDRGQLYKETVELNKLRAELREVEKQITEIRGQQPGREHSAGEKEVAAQTGKEQRSAPGLGKAAGEIRMAYSLTSTGQEFANALEDRGFIVAQVSSVEAEQLNQQERERLKALGRDAPKQIRKGDEWMAQKGGAAAFNKTQQDSAQRSYEKWLEGRDPEDPRRPMAFDKYVDYVQERYEGASLQKYNKFRPDELVVIDRWGSIHQLTYANTGDSFKDRAAHLQDIDRSPLFNVADARAVMDDTQQQRREEQTQRFKVEVGKTESEIRLAYKLTATGQEFANALEDRGFILAQVNAADIVTEKARTGAKEKWQELRQDELVVINQYGNVYRLSDRTTGDDWKARQERLADIDRAPLLSVTQSRAVAEDLQQHRRDEQAQRFKVELGKTESEIRLAYRITATGQEFANALEDRGFVLAHVTATDAEKLNRWQEAEAKEKGQQPPAEYRQYREGQLIVVNQFGNLYRLSERNTGADAKALDQRFADMDRASLSSVTKAQGTMQKLRQHRAEEYRQRGEQWREKQEQLKEHGKRPGVVDFAIDEERARAQPKGRDARDIHAALHESDRPKPFRSDAFRLRAFLAALDEQGISLARVTQQEAAKSHREATFAREAGNHAPSYSAGEIVAVTVHGTVHRLDEKTTGLDADQFKHRLAKLDGVKLQSLEATKAFMIERGKQERSDLTAERMERARKPLDFRTENTHDAVARGLGATARQAVTSVSKVDKLITRTVGKALDAVASTVGALLSFFFADAPKTKEQVAAIRDDNRRSAHADAIAGEKAGRQAASDHQHDTATAKQAAAAAQEQRQREEYRRLRSDDRERERER